MGPVRLLDIVVDWAGLRFGAYKPCNNSFADPWNNRYITCMNGRLSEATAAPWGYGAGQLTGATTGGLIVSDDFGKAGGGCPTRTG